jgi:hypothetical protein
LLVGKIVAALEDRDDAMLSRLITKPRRVLDLVADAGCGTWAQVSRGAPRRKGRRFAMALRNFDARALTG